MLTDAIVLVAATQWLVIVALGGGLAGLVVSVALRLPWRWRRLFGDMLFAVLVAVGVAFALAAYDEREQAVHGQFWMVAAAGAAAPALGRLLASFITARSMRRQMP